MGGLLGAIIGSFCGALVVRWPIGQSVIHGQSRCDHCGRTLNATDLVPIFSFLWLKGRSRCCGLPIGHLHLTIELACAAVGIISLFYFGEAGILGAGLGWTLVTLAALDLQHLWLPDRLTLPLAVLGLLASICLPPDPMDHLIGAIAGYGSLAIIAFLYRCLRGREGLGGGDPKLLGAIGAWTGWMALPFILLLASTLGLLWILLIYIRKGQIRPGLQVPIGAFFAIAGWPIWVASQLLPNSNLLIS